MLNWQLMKHPMNWVTILLMLVLAGIAGHLALTYFGFAPAQPQNNVPDQITPATAPVTLKWDGTFNATPAQ